VGKVENATSAAGSPSAQPQTQVQICKKLHIQCFPVENFEKHPSRNPCPARVSGHNHLRVGQQLGIWVAPLSDRRTPPECTPEVSGP